MNSPFSRKCSWNCVSVGLQVLQFAHGSAWCCVKRGAYTAKQVLSGEAFSSNVLHCDKRVCYLQLLIVCRKGVRFLF